jgi:hypothetical protein
MDAAGTALWPLGGSALTVAHAFVFKRAQVYHKESDGLEPFLRPNQELFNLFLKPSTEWIDHCLRVIREAHVSAHTVEDSTLSNDITIVTTLLDLKRATDAGNDFKRTMEEYYARFNYILDRGFKMIVFMPFEFKEHLRIQVCLICLICLVCFICFI